MHRSRSARRRRTHRPRLRPRPRASRTTASAPLEAARATTAPRRGPTRRRRNGRATWARGASPAAPSRTARTPAPAATSRTPAGPRPATRPVTQPESAHSSGQTLSVASNPAAASDGNGYGDRHEESPAKSFGDGGPERVKPRHAGRPRGPSGCCRSRQAARPRSPRSSASGARSGASELGRRLAARCRAPSSGSCALGRARLGGHGLQVEEEGARVLVAVRGRALQALGHDPRHGAGCVGRRDLEGDRVRGRNLDEVVCDRLALERQFSRDRLVDEDAQRPDVGPSVDVARSLDLLGRHVRGRAEGHPGGGHPRRALGVDVRDAEVEELGDDRRRPCGPERRSRA